MGNPASAAAKDEKFRGRIISGRNVITISVFTLIVSMSYVAATPESPLCNSFHLDSNSLNITCSDMMHLPEHFKPIQGWKGTFWCNGDVNSTNCYTITNHPMKYGNEERGPYICAYNGSTYACRKTDGTLIASFVVEALSPSPSPSPTMPPAAPTARRLLAAGLPIAMPQGLP